jgi:hypothetical protein
MPRERSRLLSPSLTTVRLAHKPISATINHLSIRLWKQSHPSYIVKDASSVLVRVPTTGHHTHIEKGVDEVLTTKRRIAAVLAHQGQYAGVVRSRHRRSKARARTTTTYILLWRQFFPSWGDQEGRVCCPIVAELQPLTAIGHRSNSYRVVEGGRIMEASC